MDYLSGKYSGGAVQDNVEKKSKSVKTNDSVFMKVCKTVIDCLNPDEQAAISDKFLSNKIKDVMGDKELVDCINAFFKNNLNISETSRNAFLHRNTLLYRIDKIHKNTGLNIRNFDDAMSFKILSIIYDKTNEKLGRR